MEESQQISNSNPSYWASVGIAGLIFGIIVFVLGLIVTYLTINSEPTGSMLSPMQFVGLIVCLIGAFGGMLATWHYAREYDVPFTLGTGALIGLFTGIVIAIVNILLSQGWHLIDPKMTQHLIDHMVANIQASNMADQQKQQTIDMMAKSLRNRNQIGTQLLWGLPMFGILNLLTGMIGAKMFSKKDEDNF
ncbi:MAG TPA: DUF4199 domain-containing protein [Balneolaceae bacterium]|nr:DUF4199 domain-containing protein [Balneolaceae bacterium]